MLPAEGSTYARQLDDLYIFIFLISAFFFLLIAGLLGYFVWRYRRRGPDDVTPRITHNFKLEVVWSVVPLIIIMVIFFWGFDTYMEARVAPHESLEIQAVGKGGRFVVVGPAGGGYGEPRRRDPDKVLGDVLDGFVTRGQARETYGVAITEGLELDREGTARLRGAG